MSVKESSVPKKKFGLITAIAMVVGTVIGSGVFKSAGSVLEASDGNMWVAILAWLIGGFIITISTYAFAIAASKNAKGSGIIDFIEDLVGPKISYIVAWFLNFVYFPTLIAVVCWLGGSITNTILGLSVDVTWYFAIVYFLGTYALNIFGPKLAAKWQVSTTTLKLIPLILIAVVGLIYGLINGNTVTSFTTIVSTSDDSTSTSMVTAVASAVALTAFAYDGWVAALGVTEELRDPKKNLAKALILGSLIIVAIYLLFFIGLSGVITNEEAIEYAGDMKTSVIAAQRLFGTAFGSVVSVLILVSVLGTINGLTFSGTRGMHQICSKGHGPKQEHFSKLAKNDAPISSGVVSFITTLLWGIFWYFDYTYYDAEMDISVLPIVFLYGSFIFVYVDVIRNFKELNVFKRYIIPIVAIVGAIYMIYGAASSSISMFLFFCIIVFIILLIGYLLYEPKKIFKMKKIVTEK